MTDAPIEDRARALSDDSRFCEWLDAQIPTSRSNSWPHNRTTATRWLERECGVESLGHIARDPEAGVAFEQIAERFAQWDRKQVNDPRTR